MPKPTLYPAILSKTYKDYAYKIRESAKHFKGVHIDVMDGKFVRNKTYNDMKKIRELRPKKLFFDIHLMVKDPVAAILEWSDIGDRFLVHVESCDNIPAVVQLVRGLKKKIGLVINPKTPVSKVNAYLKDIDAVMIMSIVPGKSGQRFIPSTLRKVRALKKRNEKFRIVIDGGVNSDTFGDIASAGVDTFVMGSYIWSGKPLGAIKKEIINVL